MTSPKHYRPEQAWEHFIPYLNFVPDWFIDCGPGSGSEYLDARRKWPDVKLIGIEPSPAGFAAASSRFPTDGMLINAAVWSEDCERPLFKADDLNHSCLFQDRASIASLAGGGEKAWIEILGEWPNTVQCRSLDSLDREHGPFDNSVLWMDIEDSERAALIGAADLLSIRAIRAVNLETRPWFAEEVSRVLLGNGFRKVREYLACNTYRDEVWVLGE